MKGTVRILGGALGGRRLAVPPGIRPTGSKVREALFDLWQERLSGAGFLELFAGSGAVGFEALSRGARRVTFVEGAPAVLRRLAASRRELAAEAATTILRRSLPGRLGPLRDAPYDLLFADPPYRFRRFEALLAAVAAWAAEGAVLALEHPPQAAPPERCQGWERTDRRAYGGSVLTLYERRAWGGGEAAP